MKTWRGALYGAVLLAAGWIAWVILSDNDGPTAKGFPLVVFVTSTNAVKMTLPETSRVAVVPLGSLENVLEKHAIDMMRRPVIVLAHPEADKGVAIAALDAARKAGAPEVTLEINVVE